MAIVCPRVIVVADDIVRKVRLMTRRQLQRLFPQSTIIPERVGGLVKSWIVQAWFPAAQEIRRG